MGPAEREHLLDLLSDLKHDLGKYIRLPFMMLPPGADWHETRTALHHALLQTRSGPAGHVPAREIWAGFLRDAEAQVGNLAAFGELEAAVGKALSWERELDGDGPLSRDAIEKDLGAVQDAIQKLRLEAARHG